MRRLPIASQWMAVALLSAAVAGCAAPPLDNSSPPEAVAPPSLPLEGVVTIEPLVRGISSAFFDRRNKHSAIRFYYSGGIFGSYNGRYWDIETKGDTFELNVEDLTGRLGQQARSLDSSELRVGVRAFPTETRIAQINPRILSWQRAGVNGHTAFRAPEDVEVRGRELFLMYFDRPCRLYGEVVIDDLRFSVDVTITGPGLTWLQFDSKDRTWFKSGKNVSRVFLTMDGYR